MLCARTGFASEFKETPSLAELVAAGKLPPVAKRLPAEPRVINLPELGLKPGRHGGRMRLLMGKQKDIRLMTVYGYARLIGYDRNLNLVPDILKSYDVKEGRIFTFRLRKGHKWSDGHPFTSADFEYFWKDVANNPELSRSGPPASMLVDGKPPVFEAVDETTIRYTWDKPNANFLFALGGGRPLYIYMPAHYLRQYHASYQSPAKLADMIKAAGARNWVALHITKGRQYRPENPELPTLQPWKNTTTPPSQQFIFQRNPFFHRVDKAGRQLPYINEVALSMGSSKIIPAKTGSGEADLQARYLRFDHYTFLKEGEKRQGYNVRLWRIARGSQVALFPNLNAKDPQWRKLLQDVRFRRALSLAIDRHEINQVVYYGLIRESANTILPESPLFRPVYQHAWARYDIKTANKLLDDIGMTRRNGDHIRLRSNGQPLEVIVDTAGESTEQTDVLELIRDSWAKIGVKLISRSSQRDVFRKRIFSGHTIMSVWTGLENAVPSSYMSPWELAPTSQQQLQWPMWGLYSDTNGRAGKPPSLVEARELQTLIKAWERSTAAKERTEIWHKMLSIYTDQVFSIGVVNGSLQPVVVSNALNNVPEKGIYNWNPGAYFGIYMPDTFWFSKRAN
ncbi:MAG: ABC transporter substrate-binding protein, partial [Methyloligellaceae bacterium]